MSCLALSELSLSDQSAVRQSYADAVARNYRAVVTLLDSPASIRCHPPAAPSCAGESNPLPVMEPAA